MKDRAKCRLGKESRGIVAIDEDGEYCAGVIFDTWSVTSGQCHVVIENPMVLRRGFLHEVFCYFFNTCGKILLVGVTPSNNDAALRFNKKIGFREVYRIPNGHDYNVAQVIQEMRKDECRYLNHGQQQLRNTSRSVAA